jgi:hypothetical protein
MKTFFCIAAGVLAAISFGSEARALTASQGLARPAVERAAKPVADTGQIRHRRRAGAFGNHCAYNCYAVPRSCAGCCLGRYGYRRYAYDEDLPTRYRWDWEASPIDNATGMVYGFAGVPVTRVFERVY